MRSVDRCAMSENTSNSMNCMQSEYNIFLMSINTLEDKTERTIYVTFAGLLFNNISRRHTNSYCIDVFFPPIPETKKQVIALCKAAGLINSKRPLRGRSR